MQRRRRKSTLFGASEFLRTGRVREDAVSVWKRRRHGAMVCLLMLALLVPVSSALAAESVGVLTNFGPTTVVDVGDTNVPATFTVFNTSTAPDDLGTVTVTDMTLIPSCSTFDPGCDSPGSVADPGTFALSATGTGGAGTACAGRTFNITVINPSTGEVRFSPADGLPVVLGPPLLASDTDNCRIEFTYDVLKQPNHDALPEVAGTSTVHLSSVSGVHLNGTPVAMNNNEVSTVAGGGPVLITPTITTTASPGVEVGGQVTDTAVLSGGTNPTGTITFVLYSDPTCTTQVFTDQATVAGNGTYTSAPFTTTAPGTFYWRASYSGDAAHNPVANACNDPAETVVVTDSGRATPTITTTASPGVDVGGQVTDTAVLAGGTNPTGTITFVLYSDPTCTTQVFTDQATVAGNGTYTSDPFTTTTAGTFYWRASYSGDANNNPVANACNEPAETVVVSGGGGRVTPTLTTQVTPAAATVGQSVVDTATLTGGNAPTGTITFIAFPPGDTNCTGAPIYSSQVPVNGNGSYVSTPAFVPTAPGQYRFIAGYSGDLLNTGVAGACNDPNESTTVTAQPLPSITVAKNATPGSLPAPTGVFTFSVAISNTSAVPTVVTSINDSVYGNLATRAGVNTCDDLVGDTLAPGTTLTCAFEGSFTGVAGASETDVVTVVATDAGGNQATGQDSATVLLTAPVPPSVPSVQIEVSPTPPTLQEPGGPVVYRVTVTNTSNPVDLTITSLIDSIYGNVAALPEPNTCDSLIGVVLSPGESATCQFTVQFTGDAGVSRSSTMTVTAVTPTGVVVTDSAPTVTVSITDALPVMSLSIEASPDDRPEPGGLFTYRIVVTNRSGESVVLTSLVSDVHGNLNGRGSCETGVSIPAGASYTCSYSAQFTGESRDRLTNLVSATVVDDEGNSATERREARVRLTRQVAASPTPTPTPSPTPTPTPTATVSPTPSASPTAGPTPTASPSPVPTTTASPKGPTGIVRTGIESLEWLALAMVLLVMGTLFRSAAPSTKKTGRRKG
jgi:hypothetical protein